MCVVESEDVKSQDVKSQHVMEKLGNTGTVVLEIMITRGISDHRNNTSRD